MVVGLRWASALRAGLVLGDPTDFAHPVVGGAIDLHIRTRPRRRSRIRPDRNRSLAGSRHWPFAGSSSSTAGAVPVTAVRCAPVLVRISDRPPGTTRSPRTVPLSATRDGGGDAMRFAFLSGWFTLEREPWETRGYSRFSRRRLRRRASARVVHEVIWGVPPTLDYQYGTNADFWHLWASNAAEDRNRRSQHPQRGV
jgi:hypothetical protein